MSFQREGKWEGARERASWVACPWISSLLFEHQFPLLHTCRRHFTAPSRSLPSRRMSEVGERRLSNNCELAWRKLHNGFNSFPFQNPISKLRPAKHYCFAFVSISILVLGPAHRIQQYGHEWVVGGACREMFYHVVLHSRFPLCDTKCESVRVCEKRECENKRVWKRFQHSRCHGASTVFFFIFVFFFFLFFSTFPVCELLSFTTLRCCSASPAARSLQSCLITGRWRFTVFHSNLFYLLRFSFAYQFLSVLISSPFPVHSPHPPTRSLHHFIWKIV